MLEVSNLTDDPDFNISQCIKKILDAADQVRNARTLANGSFSYNAEHRWYGNIVNMSGFIHHLVKCETVLWSPIFQIPMSLSSIGTQSQLNLANIVDVKTG